MDASEQDRGICARCLVGVCLPSFVVRGVLPCGRVLMYPEARKRVSVWRAGGFCGALALEVSPDGGWTRKDGACVQKRKRVSMR